VARTRRSNGNVASGVTLVAWSIDVQCDTCQLNIVSGLPKRTCEKVAFHPLCRFTGEAYKWIQYIDQVPYSSRYQYVRPSVLVLGASRVRKMNESCMVYSGRTWISETKAPYTHQGGNQKIIRFHISMMVETVKMVVLKH
jgi:hypothetical protein